MRLIIYLISIACLLCVGCKKKNNTLTDPPTVINFSIETINSNNNYVSTANRVSFKEKKETWFINSLDEIESLSREIRFDVELENEDTINFGFWFGKNENLNKDDIILEKAGQETNIGIWGDKWKYKDFELGLENFYQSNNSEVRITINNTVIFTKFNSENIDLLKLEKAIENGEEKVYAEFIFEGTAYGWYDPNGELSEYFKITNGSFKGIID